MKERFKEFAKKLISIKILIGLPLVTVVLILGYIDGLIWIGSVLVILGFREAGKFLRKDGIPSNE